MADRVAKPVWIVLGALCLGSAATIVVLGSKLTFFNDEWYVLLLRPGLSAHTVLEPHNGHLSAIPILVYKGFVAAFGLDAQVPFRIALAIVVVALGLVVFAYVRERCGDVLALLAAALLLFLGSAWQDLLCRSRSAWSARCRPASALSWRSSDGPGAATPSLASSWFSRSPSRTSAPRSSSPRRSSF